MLTGHLFPDRYEVENTKSVMDPIAVTFWEYWISETEPSLFPCIRCAFVHADIVPCAELPVMDGDFSVDVGIVFTVRESGNWLNSSADLSVPGVSKGAFPCVAHDNDADAGDVPTVRPPPEKI
jgi:hypothetical protein